MSTSTTNTSVTFSDDQALNIVLAQADAEGYPVAGPSPGNISVAIQDTTGDGISSQYEYAFDTANPLSLWIKSAPATAGETPADSGTITLTTASGAVEITPFTRTRGAVTGVTETTAIVALSAVPSTVTFGASSAPASSTNAAASAASTTATDTSPGAGEAMATPAGGTDPGAAASPITQG